MGLGANWPMAPMAPRGPGDRKPVGSRMQPSRRAPGRGKAPPWPPLDLYGVQFWLVLLVDLLIFWNSIARDLITVFLYSSMVLFKHARDFLLDIRPIEELQGSSSSPRREEVGRRTLRDYGGFLPPFFYRARFRLSTSTTRKRQARKMYPNTTPITSGVEESNSPRRALLLLLSDSSGGHHLKKNMHSCKQVAM